MLTTILRAIKFLVIFTVTTGIIGLSALTGLYFYFAYDLPNIRTLKDYEPPQVSEVFADDGTKIGEFWEECRFPVSITDVPPLVIKAFIASEDTRFFEHRGVDIRGIGRAFIENLKAGHIVQGGSTITQQIARSLLLTRERSLKRKFKEAILATRIERDLSKNEILELYLNQIFLGNRAYGVKAAARNYFHKELNQLTLGEIGMIAGMPQAPSADSPINNMERAKIRQRHVLERMLEEGYITKEEMTEALETDITIYTQGTDKEFNYQYAPYFTEHVRQIVLEKYGHDTLYKSGLKIYTTLNLVMSDAAQRALRNGIDALVKRRNYKNARPQGAIFAMDPITGHVKAMAGGYDFMESEFNRATQALRQPGSAFKPFTYAAALDKGYNFKVPILDAPVTYYVGPNQPPWSPKNYKDKHAGMTTFDSDIIHSRNIPTVKIANDIGLHYITAYVRKMGIQTPIDKYYSMALGANGVYLNEMVTAYATFATGGVRPTPVYITRVEDRNGKTLEEPQLPGAPEEADAVPPGPEAGEKFTDLNPELFLEGQKAIENDRLVLSDDELKILYGEIISKGYVISPQTAYLMTTLLKGVVDRGTGTVVKALGRPAAGKTGTTNDETDCWFIGFVPGHVAGVWLGFDDVRQLGKGETGGRAAAPVFLEYMKEVTKGWEVKDFSPPPGLDAEKIDMLAGGSAIYFKGVSLLRETREQLSPQSRAVDFFGEDMGF